jgi:ribosome modulation factor
MSVVSRTVTLRDYENAVAGQIRARCTFGQVENFIDACRIEEHEKTALWLWAWRQQPEDVRRMFADADVLDFVQAAARR